MSERTQNHIEQVLLREAAKLVNDPVRAPYIKTNHLAKKTDYRPQELGRVCSQLEWLERHNGRSNTAYMVTDKILDHPDVESE